jgi:hypothetical protein
MRRRARDWLCDLGLAALLVGGCGAAPAADPPPGKGKAPPKAEAKAPAPPKPDPADHFRSAMNAHVSAALRHLVTEVGEYDRCYVRFLSFYDLEEPIDLRRHVKLTNWWNNQMSFDEYFHLLKPVRGTGSRLYSLDLRDYRWNSPAWYAVAAREPRFRQPWVYFREAEALRREAGYYGVKPAEDGTTPVVVVVSGMWFLRDTLETQRSTSYYDLLFAERRFAVDSEKTYEFKFVSVKREPWPGGVDPEDGRDYPKGTYTVRTTHYRTVQDWRAYDFQDFPRDSKDLEKALGVDVVKAFAKREQIDVDQGAIVAGGRDDRRAGSIVALQNRLLAVLDGPLGPYMQTFDVNRTSGIRDYSQALMFAGRPFERGAGARAVFDAGEILFYLPNGGQGGILTDGKGKRIEVAGGGVANDSSDRTLNPGVRTFGSCITCHSGGGGYVPPDDLVKKWKAAGIKVKFDTPEQQNRFEGFFKGLDKRLAGARERYQELTADTTQPFADEPKGAKAWTGADVTAEVLRFRDRYDDTVDVQTQAREMGIPLPAFKWLAIRAGVEKPRGGVVVQRNQRAQEAVHDMAVPRSVWDDDLLRQVGLLLEAHASDPDLVKIFDRVNAEVPLKGGGR